MELNDKQIKRLARFDGIGNPFSTLLDSGYCRTLTRADQDELLTIYKEATGNDYQLHRDCGQCVAEFVRIMGMAYREGKAKADAETANKAKNPSPTDTEHTKKVNHPRKTTKAVKSKTV